MNTRDALAAISSLYRWMDWHDEKGFSAKDRARNKRRFRIPSIEQICDWLGCLLDSHYMQLILMPESEHLLKRVQRRVRRQQMLTESASAIQGVLDHILGEFALPVRSESSLDNSDYLLDIHTWEGGGQKSSKMRNEHALGRIHFVQRHPEFLALSGPYK